MMSLIFTRNVTYAKRLNPSIQCVTSDIDAPISLSQYLQMKYKIGGMKNSTDKLVLEGISIIFIAT